MSEPTLALNPAATDHLPFFIVPPGGTDGLMIAAGAFLLALLFFLGVSYFWLHAYPERKAHKANKLQLEIVAVLGLLALLTHQHVFWVAALLLAMVTIPDVMTPLQTIADSLRRIAGREPAGAPESPADAASPEPRI